MARSPIPIDEFDASVRDPMDAVFLPAAAYGSEAFHQFELGAVWRKEWISVGRVEEIASVGDYFSIDLSGEPLLIVRAADDEIVAMSAVCRHRGMLIAQDLGHRSRTFVCPYHGWGYDLCGRLTGARHMDGVRTFDRNAIALPRLKVELWHGFIFVNFDAAAAPLAARLSALDPVMKDWSVGELQGESTVDANYKIFFDYPWNWKVYAEGQSECYHCDTLHGQTPIISALDMESAEHPLYDPAAGVFQLQIRAWHIDATLNHTGHAIFPAIPSLSEEQRWVTHTIIIAPNIFLQLMPDSVIALNWMPTGPTSMRVKRNRLYPRTTLAQPSFAELHREESGAIREFVGQDEYAFRGVQTGLKSCFAPRGPVSSEEPVIAGFNRWLVERYRAADLNWTEPGR